MRARDTRVFRLRVRLHSAHSVLYSVDFAEIERLQTTGAWAEAAADYALGLVRLPALPGLLSQG